MKLLISGGHPSPAYAVIDHIQQHRPDIELVFAGRVIAQHTTGQAAGELEEMAARKIPFFSVYTAKWGRSFWQKIAAGASVLTATAKAYQLAGQIKPDVFLSFGSYVALPLALACKLRRIPIITHEQTRVAGISNRLIARIASIVAISYPESAAFFSHRNIVCTGLPLRPQLFAAQIQVPTWADNQFQTSTLPILYVTGGSTGSHAVNELIAEELPGLLQKYRVIHPCGKAHNHHDWPTRLAAVSQQLPLPLRERYIVLEHVSVTDLAWIYRQQTIVFGRAGANTTAEVAAFSLPAVFVPLPHSNYDEQHKNAEALVEAGHAILIEQEQLTGGSLFAALDQVAQLPRRTVPVSSASTATTALLELVLQLYEKKG